MVIDCKLTSIEEYYITDLIELMVADGRPVIYLLEQSETETMGVDDPEALKLSQELNG